MRFARQPSWTISIGESQELLTALYVRHCAGLDPRTDPVIPPLAFDPPPVRPLPPAQAELVSAQWLRWWDRLLRAAGDRRRPAWPLPATLADTPELADLPDLRELLAAQLAGPDFPVWLSGRQLDEADFMTAPGRPQLNEIKLIAAMAKHRRRPARPFQLSITVIPVQAKQGWRLAPDHLLITRSLLTDVPSYQAFLEPVVAELV
jgi:hypothetical protein